MKITKWLIAAVLGILAVIIGKFTHEYLQGK